MKWLWVIGFCWVWAQDSVRAVPLLRGDSVEVQFFWKGRRSESPLGANLVVLLSPASAIAWQQSEVSQRGRWDQTQTADYLPLYLTGRKELGEAARLSLNLLSARPSAGLSFSGEWELIGTWKAPILHFGDTLRLSWAMETGEIVLSPFIRAKNRFVFLPIPPLWLCPALPALRIENRAGTLSIAPLESFRPENLTIRWYRDGIFIGEQDSLISMVEGAYYAVVAHRCGSEARTDTFLWRTARSTVLEKAGWRFYPNPTNGNLWIEAPYATTLRLSLCDAMGRLLYATELQIDPQQAHHQLLPKLPMGTYSLKVHTPQETFSLLLLYAP